MSTRIPRKFVGGYRPDGLPHAHLEAYGIPARDLDGDELDDLTSEQLKIADDSGLYEMARKPEKKSAPAKAKAPTGNRQVTGDAPESTYLPITPDAADAPIVDTPVEPDQEGEG